MKQPQEWWIQRGGSSSGPYTPRQLKQAALDGSLDRQSLVRVGKNGKWIRAGDVQGLFAAVAETVASPPPAAEPNPYQSPLPIDAPMQATSANRPAKNHWRIVTVTAVVMLVIAALDLFYALLGGLLYVLIGGVPNQEISGFKLWVSGIVAVLTAAGAVGTLRRKRWGVGLLAVMTLLHCYILMIFVLGDSFSACWRSFDTPNDPPTQPRTG